MSNLSANSRGILAMVAACGCFSANDAATKAAAVYLPTTEIVAIRAAFALILAIFIVAWRRELFALPHIRNRYLLLRAFIEAVTGVLIIYSLSQMPIANLTAILLIQPFLMTITGAMFLNEQVGWRSWTAVAAGFAGVLLVVQPGTDGFNWVSLVVLVAACLSFTRDLLVRKIHADVPTTVISFSSALLAVPVGLAGAAVEPWRLPDMGVVAIIAIAGAFLALAFLLTVIAFRGTDVSTVGPFRYSIVVFAVIFGAVLFDEIPDMTAFVGIGIIVAAGLYMLHRETTRRRRPAAAAH